MTLPAQPGATIPTENRGGAANLRLWQPGQSGNPGGRPKGLARRVRELVGDDGQRLAEVFIEVRDNPDATLRERMEAATWLADRGWGKPTQHIDQDVWKREGGPMRADIDPERLEVTLRELQNGN